MDAETHSKLNELEHAIFRARKIADDLHRDVWGSFENQGLRDKVLALETAVKAIQDARERETDKVNSYKLTTYGALLAALLGVVVAFLK